MLQLGIVLGVPLLCFLGATGSSLLAYPVRVAFVLLSIAFLFAQGNLPKTSISIATVCFCCYVLFGWTTAHNTLALAFQTERVHTIEGRLVEDSLLTAGAKQLVRLRVENCGTADGASGSAQGIISALLTLDQSLVSGSVVSLQGELAADGSLFFASSLEVLSMRRDRVLRRTLLGLLERRFASVLDDESSRALALMLLLGRTSDAAFPLKELSMASGCSHLLALSGMHLHFFIMLFSWILRPLCGARRAKIISVFLVIPYVVLVGPKPSLVRSLGMALVALVLHGEMAPYYGYLLVACLQTALFPATLSSMGSLFSYASFGGLLCNRLCMFYRPSWTEAFFASAFAILFTAIPTIVVWGSWHIGGLLISPFASHLMYLLMGASLLVGIGGRACAWAVNLPYRWLVSLLTKGGSLFGVGMGGQAFVLYLCFMLTLILSIGYAERAAQIRRRNSYELEIRLRFTEGHTDPTNQGGPSLEQEIWTEFPSQPPCP